MSVPAPTQCYLSLSSPPLATHFWLLLQNGYCFRHYYLHESLRVEEENKLAQQRRAQQFEKNEDDDGVDKVLKIASVSCDLSSSGPMPGIQELPPNIP